MLFDISLLLFLLLVLLYYLVLNKDIFSPRKINDVNYNISIYKVCHNNFSNNDAYFLCALSSINTYKRDFVQLCGNRGKLYAQQHEKLHKNKQSNWA